jgi:histidine triad (HIT) family protein
VPANSQTGCVFCSIAAGDTAAEVIERTSDGCVFLDRRPLFVGHCLVVPAKHIETINDVPAGALTPLFATVQRVARAVEAGLGCDGTFVAMNNKVSQSVPHLHVHVVPRKKKDGLRGFFWPRQSYASDEAMAATGEKIRSALEKG